MQSTRNSTHNSAATFYSDGDWLVAGGDGSTRSSQKSEAPQQVQGYFNSEPEPSCCQKIWSCLASCCAAIFCCKCCCDQAYFEKSEHYGHFAQIANDARAGTL